ncbi:hypothetical protein Fcan01_21990 [Folsomia candida]|uniref:F-box domain-containing protein n=1 Tax=Folsomia candida TaxID=158441 RepID=A0A226DER1_FOLCA|nr:hypothetical protein Fcan01_21990 [Folsomia candida]
MANHDAELLVEYDFKPRPTLKLAHTKSEARLFKSILLRKMYNKVWHRYTVLPNVEGQKYTIGNPFITGVEKISFTCLPLYEKGWKLPDTSLKMVTLCEILCVGGSFFVTPIKVGAVCINGVKLDGTTLLNFGDTLALRKLLEERVWKRLTWDEGWNGDSSTNSKSGRRGKRDINNWQTFLFSERELDPEAFNTLHAMNFKPRDDSSFLTTFDERRKLNEDKIAKCVEFYGNFHPGANELVWRRYLHPKQEKCAENLENENLPALGVCFLLFLCKYLRQTYALADSSICKFHTNFICDRLTRISSKSASIPWDTSIILSRILIHLNFVELKSVRLVSRLFNQEAIILIKKRGYARLDFGTYTHTNLMTYFRYVNEMRDCLMPSWKLKLFKINEPHQFVRKHLYLSSLQRKFQYDINHLLTNLNSYVTILKLSGPIYSSLDWEFRMQILDKLSGTLVEICFSGNSGTRDVINPARMVYFQKILKFRPLQKFVLCLDRRSRWLNRPNFDFIPPNGHILTVSGIRSLHLDSEKIWTHMFINLSASFPNLEEVTIHSLSLIGLQFLFKLARPLMTLILTGFLDFGREHLPQFEQLLEKHSKSLVTLEFILPKFGEIAMPLPVFDILINLKIGFPTERRLCTTIEFGADKIPPFDKHLASLKSLTLWMARDQTIGFNAIVWKEYGVLFEAFFPLGDDIEVVPRYTSLRVLDIPYEQSMYSDLERRNGIVLPRGAKLAAMFPNVVNKWMNKIRGI